jgi:hypothetical protein
MLNPLDEAYLIWSNEHLGWWRPDGNGYAQHLSEAGQFTREVALLYCLHGIHGTAERLGMLPELPVPLRDLLGFTSVFLAEFPDRGGEWA